MSVELREIYPGYFAFDCAPLRASIAPQTCARNYTASLNVCCLRCPIGHEHAHGVGREKSQCTSDGRIRVSHLTAQTCIRCGHQAMRRIEPGLCVSCANRHIEVVRTRNCKGTFPREVAAKLYECQALLVGGFTPPEGRRPLHIGKCNPTLERMSGGAFVVGLFSGRDEFDRWLAEHWPDASVLDFCQTESVAQLAGYPRPKEPECRCTA
jgi:hypothetical protein